MREASKPTPILDDPLVESTARLMCRAAGQDPDEVVSVSGAEIIIDGERQPVEMMGPRWMAYAVEASEKILEAGRKMVAQFVRASGRA